MANKANLIRLDLPPSISNLQNKIGSSLISIAWLCVNFPALQWLSKSLRDTSRFNLILICVVTIALIIQAIRDRRSLKLSPTPVIQPQPLILMFGAALSASLGRWLLDIEQITVLLFALGTYGLGGLFLSPSVWRKGLPTAVLIACILPFSVQFSTGLGFPARVLTSHVVEQILASWHITAISSHDIIVLENGIAHVDLPCSGLKSLWTGTLFLLVATWLENRQIKLQWLLVCATNILLLTVANIGRVLLLVLSTNVLKQPGLERILHTHLGLLGFTSACLLTWLMLQKVPRYSSQLTHTKLQPIIETTVPTQPAPLAKQILIIACILGLAFIPQPQIMPAKLIAINLPVQMYSTPLKLTATEQDFFADYKDVLVQKQRFEWKHFSGSILLVNSSAWQAHHSPELCFVGNGLKVDAMVKQQLSSDVLGRWLSLENGTMSAAYWFQSPKRTTDEFLSRIWGELTRKDSRWVLVSVLFDKNETPNTPETSAFVSSIRNAINQSLN